MFSDYPQGASDEAKKALKHKEEFDSKCGTNVGWDRAKQLANREALSEEDVKSIHSFLSRHKVYDQTKFIDDDGKEICGSIMFSAWGGDSMVNWASKTAAKIKEEQKNYSMDKNIEKRVFEIRMDYENKEDGDDIETRLVSGYAAVFDKYSEDLGGFKERIEKGAFADAISISDVRALFNHDANYILARNTSGTLRLMEDEVGLKYEFEMPKTSFGNDLLQMIKRGDVNQSSFGFTVENDTWSEKDGMVIRTINKVKRLYDVSPVTYPAYPDASVAVRNLQKQNEKEEETPVDYDGKMRDKIVKAAMTKHA